MPLLSYFAAQWFGTVPLSIGTMRPTAIAAFVSPEMRGYATCLSECLTPFAFRHGCLPGPRLF